LGCVLQYINIKTVTLEHFEICNFEIMTIIFVRNATARKAYSGQRDAEIDKSRPRHQLAKKPRLNLENLGTESPGDSPNPGEYSEEGVYLADHFAR
jgi:hypothetical protein